MDLLEVNQEELKEIFMLVDKMTMRWSHKTATKENLQELAYEITSRAAEMGFIINVDVTPALVGVGPFDVAIVGRIQSQEPDHDRIRWETKKKWKEDGKL